MEAGISSIVTPVVQSLMEPVKKHLGFLVSSTKYVKDMEEKMDQLKLSEKDIQNNLDEANEKMYKVSEHVSQWLAKVKETKEKAQSIPTGGVGCFNMAKRYKAGKKSCDILKEIQNLNTWKSEIVFTKEQIPLAVIASTSTGPSTSTPDGTQNNFKSRELIYNAALKFLQTNNESHKKIALCGMGGVGKTTMMEQLLNEVKASNVFDRVVKVVIGENTNLIALQKAIAKYITNKDLEEDTQDARADRLRKMFEGMADQGKKTLVIMDDIWSVVNLKDVGLSPLPNGFKLLITSRFDYVCTKMGVKIDSVYKIPVLDAAEAKALFFGIVGPSTLDGDDPELYKIGEDIVSKCRGLPIALKIIANSLIGNIKEAWKETLSNLQRDDLQDLDEIVHRIFEMSYNNLKREDDKSVFLLSGLFPDDFDIRIEDLVRYGWGLKLFTKVHTLREARRRTIVCVNNLTQANLLIESEYMGCVKMHDLVRAFALSNFTKVKQASIVNHDNMSGYQPISYERILLKCTGKSLHKFPQDIYEKTDKLEVASYEEMGIPLLPTMFEHSTKLRTLCLRSCWLIDDISLLGSLSNLEALSIVDCGLRRLPSMIGMLEKLKLLDLTGCVDLRIDDGVLQNLKRLEELYMRAYKNSRIMFTDANCEELEILSRQLFALELEFFENKAQLQKVSFEKIERFRISIGCRLVGLEDDKKYSFKNTIKFVGDCNELLECKIRELSEKTEELHLQVNDIHHLKNIVSMHHSFSNLKVLYVSDCKELTYLFTVAMVSSLKKLERLEVSKCPAMTTLVDCTVGVIRFPKLNFMYLKELQNMVSLCRTVIELPELVELKLDLSGGIQSLLNKEVVIPKLEKLEIDDMEQIWPYQISTDVKNDVSMMRVITVKMCSRLINIFPNNPLPMLNDLKELEVEDCGSIEVVFNIDFETVSEMDRYISRLRRNEVEYLCNLRELRRMRGVSNSSILINGFQGVQSIKIRGCNMFVTTNFDLIALINYIASEWNVKSEVEDYNIPDVTYLLHTCHHLTDLQLSRDERVEVVFDMDRQLATIQPQLLPHVYLERIYLAGLEEMSHVWTCCNWSKLKPQHKPFHFPFQYLTDIYLGNCNKIKYLFSPLMAKYLSNLKSVYIWNCGGIEEVIARRDDEHEENTTFTFAYQHTTLFPNLDILDTTLFPHLYTLDIQGLPNLKSVDEFQSGQVIGASWSLCQYPRKISVESCPGLSSLIPWYAVGEMRWLRELEIKKCSSMTEVFECESINNVNEGGAPLRNVTLVVGPQLKNLKRLFISECDRLPHIFTFSTLQTLHHLKELKVKTCKAMQVIVQQENETSSDCVIFPLLETLELEDLPNLKGFFLGMNDFLWPSLDNVLIKDCPDMMMFTTGQSITPKLKYIRTRLGTHGVECGLNFQGTISQAPNMVKPALYICILLVMMSSLTLILYTFNNEDQTRGGV